MEYVRRWFPVLAVAVLLACFLGCGSDGDHDSNNTSSAQSTSDATLKIIHVNDVHSHLDADSLELTFDGLETECEAGDMARVAAKIAELKMADSESLVLHAGDAVQGTLYYTMFKGEADAQVMNAIGFDAMAIGNHEFDDGDDQLAQFIDWLDTQVISANVEVPETNPLDGLYTSYVVQQVNGEDVRIIGLTISGKTPTYCR